VPPPTFGEVAYGQSPKQVLTFWQAKSDKPTPWLFHIHGGAWTSQQRIFGLVTTPGFVQDMLDHGISVVSVEYRFLDEATADGLHPPVKGPMLDCARALQFVRSKSKEWNLDKKRVALCGDSAGGCTALWLAFHKDLADPTSRDLVARESTRPLCVAVQHPQTTLDPQQMRDWIPNLEYGDEAFGINADPVKKLSSFEVFLAEREKLLPLINEYSPYALVTRDAPPVFMFYYSSPAIGQIQKETVHSANFGAKLQEKCQRLGVECELVYPGAPGIEANPYHKIYFEKYFLEKLLGWAPKRASLMTKWAAQVNPKAPLPEYPRPQMVRADWQNLNGIWQYQPGAEGDATPTGKTLNSEILVPYPVESALSGVMEHHARLWYRRTFTVPAAWKGRQLMLNFGAVDYEAQVFVNGRSVGTHTGGYEAFSYNITPFLKGSGPQELIVRVFDTTGQQGQPRGKQTTTPGGVMYTSTTGIWQTVWLEPVAVISIASLHIVPDVDKGVVNFTVSAPGASANTSAIIQIRDGKNVVGRVAVKPNVPVSIPVPKAKLWSPDSPFLYDVSVTLQDGKAVVDRVSSYFGMRKISLGKDGGFTRMLLNNKFVFQIGPLDQGFWPDGIYTAPTDAALRSDIEAEKSLGFNMVRKHIKVEPARWYYWADKLGILVWQDMPSPAPPADKPAFEKQMVSTIQTHWNSPAIITWVIFNEGGGRYDTARLVNQAKALDPSRLVNRDSGAGYESDAPGADGKVGDVDDVHSYPAPAFPTPDANQASANGEYGGIGFLLKGHLYRGDNFNYETYTMAATQVDLQDEYGLFSSHLKDYRDKFGLSAAVYTEITDVEEEINGLLSYDRVLKVDPAQIRLANTFKYVLPTYQAILPTSQIESQPYKYVFDQPAPNWSDKSFDDSAWMSGPGGFGTGAPGAGLLGTVWNTPDVWLRRTFTLPTLSTEKLNQLLLTDFHDDGIEVYFNGVLAYKKDGYIFRDYEYTLLSDAAKAALVVGGANVMAVHCHQITGGQYVDVGLTLKVPR